ncbi:MAG: hypothetical protein IJM37_07395 [Lachnospiraceae bacterium]|nr:hypothetical protein [Lachnospiraceae bacterium]
MNCVKCSVEMSEAKLCGDAFRTGAYLTKKKKGILDTERISTVSCYFCPQCGYIELKADNPKELLKD